MKFVAKYFVSGLLTVLFSTVLQAGTTPLESMSPPGLQLPAGVFCPIPEGVTLAAGPGCTFQFMR